eukprot:scaffold21779_cov69-Skeletonema_dohrnii-CCMP3373.AAC.3
MAADGWCIYNGREAVPRNATRVRIDESLAVIPARAFYWNRNIKEVECHVDVKTVEEEAFAYCRSLRRVRMRGVEVIEGYAFANCCALTVVECGKLERIGHHAFYWCESLTSINLPSARIVGLEAFEYCKNLAAIKFGKKLERIGGLAFYRCLSLERIAIPLKDGIFTRDGIFRGCKKLKHVDLVEGEVHETIAYLQLEEWRNEMKEKIAAINQTLPNTPAGVYEEMIRMWMSSVLSNIIHYKAQHRSILNEVATLQQAFPKDLVLNNILPFLELPSHTFEGEVYGEEEEEGDINEFCRSVAVMKIS